MPVPSQIHDPVNDPTPGPIWNPDECVMTAAEQAADHPASPFVWAYPGAAGAFIACALGICVCIAWMLWLRRQNKKRDG
jgi:hypothetical protein